MDIAALHRELNGKSILQTSVNAQVQKSSKILNTAPLLLENDY